MINLIIGTMFAGKSTELLKYLRRAQIAGKKTCLLRPELDTRDFFTHDEQPLYKGIKVFKIAAQSLDKSFPQQEILTFDTIGIDEWQFFPIEHWDNVLLPFLEALQYQKKECFIAGLSGTFHLTPFEIISRTIPLCNRIQLETAICLHCGNNAFYTYRQSENNQESTDEQNPDNIGAADKYSALCWDCWHKMYKKEEK